jgi:hypothetical protein
MAKVEVTLVEAPPEALVGTKVTQLTSVTKNEPVLYLPVSFALLRIQRMAIGALHGDVRIVELLPL